MHVSTCVSVFASVKRGLSPAVHLLTLAFAPEPVVNMLLSVYAVSYTHLTLPTMAVV